MFAGMLASLALRFGVSERAAKFGLIGAAVVALVIGLGVAKCTYDRNLISGHTAKQDASNSKADRKADARAGETRRTDDSRLEQEKRELERAQANAQNDTDRRIARHRCLGLQQSARAAGRQPPACDRPGVPAGTGGAIRGADSRRP